MTTKKSYQPLSAELEAIGRKIVDAAYTVNKNLGPGLLKKVYEICFCHELYRQHSGLRKFILILGRFAKAKLLRMSYTERNNIIKFANLFRFGITE